MAVYHWNHLSTADFLGLNRENVLVLLPFGSMEQHGPHLPVGTDTFLVEEVIRRVLGRIQDLEVVTLPAVWCTKSNEHQNFAGSLYLQAETMLAMVHDLAAAISRSGFKRLVLMNWHGGNSDMMGVLARDIRQRHRLLAFVIDVVYSFTDMQPDQTQANPLVDIHAGRYETGMMLAAYSNFVKPGPYDDIGSDQNKGPVAQAFRGFQYLLPEGGPVRLGWEVHDLSTDGVIGDPTGANSAEGERNLEVMAERVEAILREIARFDFEH